MRHACSIVWRVWCWWYWGCACWCFTDAPPGAGQPLVRFLSADMLVKDQAADPDQQYAAHHLGAPPGYHAQRAAQHETGGNQREGGQPDGNRGDDDIGIHESQSHARDHGIDAGGKAGRSQYPEGMRTWLFTFAFAFFR